MINTPVSPKVKVPFVVGLFSASILTNISFVTPDMLNFLGPWAPFVIGTLTALLGAVVGYKVNDPLRAVPAADPAPAAPVESAPASTFPKDAVAAAEAAQPAPPVVPVFEAPAAPAA